MSDKNEEKKESKSGVLEYLKGFDQSAFIVEAIKRFYYQILGIYLPAAIVIVYFSLYWPGLIGPLTDPVLAQLDFKSTEKTLLVVLIYLGAVVILGEAVNAFTSRITTISPIKIPARSHLWYILTSKRPPLWIADSPWPLWMRIAPFPIRFSKFDRYYLTLLDEERRSLAGKIGWTAFYRNNTIAFLILALFQIISYYIWVTSPSMNIPVFLINPGKYYYLPFIVPFFLSLAFYLGYRAQSKAYRLSFWKAYRLNEMQKIMETNEGNPLLALGVKEEFAKIATEYIVNRWSKSLDKCHMDISSYLLTKAEKRFMFVSRLTERNMAELNETCEYHKDFFKSKSYLDPPKLTGECRVCIPRIRNELNQIKVNLSTAYREWYYGNYETVISSGLNSLNRLLNIVEGINESPANEYLSLKEWKTLRAYYQFSGNYYQLQAWQEIRKSVVNWKWCYNDNSPDSKTKEGQEESAGSDSMHIDSEHLVNELNYDDAARFLWKHQDKYGAALNNIHALILNLFSRKSPLPVDFEPILEKFGGYDYDGATSAANELAVQVAGEVIPFEDLGMKIKGSHPTNWIRRKIGANVLKFIPYSESVSSLRIEVRPLPNYIAGSTLSMDPRSISVFEQLKRLIRARGREHENFNEIKSDVIVITGRRGVRISYLYKYQHKMYFASAILVKNDELLYSIFFDERFSDNESSVNSAFEIIKSLEFI